MPPRAARDSSPSSASEVGSSDDAIDDGLPQPIRLPGNDAVATDLRFVADASRLAVATLAGKLELFDLGDSEKPVSSLTTHAKSVRALEMPTSRPGIAYSVSKDRSLAVSDLAAGKIVGRVSRAHADPCSSIACLNEGGTFLATGDDNGVVNVWDSRMIGLDPANLIKGIGSEEERKKRGLVNSWKAAGDYVSDMLWAENKKRLIAAGWVPSRTSRFNCSIDKRLRFNSRCSAATERWQSSTPGLPRIPFSRNSSQRTFFPSASFETEANFSLGPRMAACPFSAGVRGTSRLIGS